MTGELPAAPDGLGTSGAPYDFAFAGAGAAGLLLAVRLSRAFPEARTLLVDPGFADLANRTFAFWCEGEPPLRDAVARSLATVRVVTDARDATRVLEDYRYHVITGEAFRRACLDELADHGRTHVLHTKVHELREDGDHARVLGDDGLDRLARWAFDSRPGGAETIDDDETNVTLPQRIVGWEIETESEVFDPSCVTLFDFRTEQGSDDLRFVYVLPFGPRRALVEHVSHAVADADAALEAYLEDVLSAGRYTIVRQEAGENPLTDALFVRKAGPRVLRIGSAGGRLKPSSGYAFMRMWEDAGFIVRSLEDRGHPFALPESPPSFRILDGLFLRAMRRRPRQMAHVFLRMFERNPADRVFRFLDERVGTTEVLALGSSLPAAPFAGALGGSLRGALKRLTAPIEYAD